MSPQDLLFKAQDGIPGSGMGHGIDSPFIDSAEVDRGNMYEGNNMALFEEEMDSNPMVNDIMYAVGCL
uniref:Uncharacterized protein n=1 Tax=Calidris pygmaea TaxID=425635 RepID=A0A8C3K6M6_9CHAR